MWRREKVWAGWRLRGSSLPVEAVCYHAMDEDAFGSDGVGRRTLSVALGQRVGAARYPRCRIGLVSSITS